MKEVMTGKVVSFSPETSVQDAMRRLVAAKVSGGPVVDSDGKLVGIVSESDIVRLLKRQSEASRNLESVKEAQNDDSMTRQVLEFFTLDWLWYVWDARSIRKIFESLIESEALKNTSVGDIASSEVVTVGPDEDMGKAAELMNRHNINRLPVVDHRGRLVGVVARGDILKGLLRAAGGEKA